jgi:hypothetical protein
MKNILTFSGGGRVAGPDGGAGGRAVGPGGGEGGPTAVAARGSGGTGGRMSSGPDLGPGAGAGGLGVVAPPGACAGGRPCGGWTRRGGDRAPGLSSLVIVGRSGDGRTRQGGGAGGRRHESGRRGQVAARVRAAVASETRRAAAEMKFSFDLSVHAARGCVGIGFFVTSVGL